MDLKRAALKELAIRELERRYKPERGSLCEYMKTMFKNLTPSGIQEFHVNWHHEEIEKKLKLVLEGKCRRLIINIPPGHSKTEEITKCFPTWALGNNPNLRFILTGYAARLTQGYSDEARDYYKSNTYRNIFPRRVPISKKQDTKEHWKLEGAGEVYASGFDGAITGKRANIFIIDDPIKPNEAATSTVKRESVNQNYGNTVVSRLADPLTDSVIIVMQRTHEEDLVGYLLDLKEKGKGDDWEVLSLPAVATKDEELRKKGDALDEFRFPIPALDILKQGMDEAVFECQYQQNPNSEVGAEFQKIWYKYHNHNDPEVPSRNVPTLGRIFSYCDPAFGTTDNGGDYCSVVTFKLYGQDIYILRQDTLKVGVDGIEDVLVDHIKTFSPEKIGIEKRQAQVVISSSLRARMLRESMMRTEIVDVLQPGSKEQKIRSLIPLYRNGQIYHPDEFRYETLTSPEKREASLEGQLKMFPRGKNDDAPDALQGGIYMVQDLLVPITQGYGQYSDFGNMKIVVDKLGRPILK